MKTTKSIKAKYDSLLEEIKNLDLDHHEKDIYHSTTVCNEIITTTYKERYNYLLGQKKALEFVLGINS